MIPSNTVNLPVCALGAGIAHAAALALVLPLMITLPAPGESSPAELVAIPVQIVAAPASLSATPEPRDLIGALMENADEGGPSTETAAPPSDLTVPAETEGADGATAALSEDVTGALPGPSVIETAPAAELPAPDSVGEEGSQDGSIQDEPIQAEPAQEQPAQEDTGPAEVANVDAVLPPLPIRVRRDDDGEAILQTRPVPREPEPQARPALQAKPARRAVPAPKRSLFGLAQPRPPAAKTGDAAPYQGSWDSLLGKPAH